MAHHEPTEQLPEQKKDRTMLITCSIISANILVLGWLLFEPVINYVPGSVGYEGAYTIMAAIHIVLLVLGNILLGAFAVTARAGTVSRASFLSAVVVLLVGWPSCFVGADLAVKKERQLQESVGN